MAKQADFVQGKMVDLFENGERMVTLRLHDGDKSEDMVVPADRPALLPRCEAEGKVFLGWNEYHKMHFGRMNYMPNRDIDLYAIYADGPAYTIESHFRGDPMDYVGKRCHFRRYVLDVYLHNAKASSGEFRINNCNDIFYYFGNIPGDEVSVTVEHTSAVIFADYPEVFSTKDITVKWESAQPLDATTEPQKIVRIMLYFSSWGIGYNEIARRTSDEIVMPAYDYPAHADNETAYISANFYHGVLPEELPGSVADDPRVVTVTDPDAPEVAAMGKVLSRFAVLADSHIGRRYNWPDYDWLYSTFDHLNAMHEQTPFDFVLQLGDNIDDGYEKSYEPDYIDYLEKIKRLTICDPVNPIDGRAAGKIPHYEMQGNHDTSMQTRFFRNKLWYTESPDGDKVAYIGFFVHYGGYPLVHFRICDTYDSYRSYGRLIDETVAFIEQSILEAKENGAKHVVLCSHFGVAQDLIGPVLQESGFGKIESLCRKYNIRLYLNGHEHNREYTLRKMNEMYDYDAAMTRQKYAVIEMREQGAVVMIYDTNSHEISRIDTIRFS